MASLTLLIIWVFWMAARMTIKNASIHTVLLVKPANAKEMSHGFSSSGMAPPKTDPKITMRTQHARGGTPNGRTSNMIMRIMATSTTRARIIAVVIAIPTFLAAVFHDDPLRRAQGPPLPIKVPAVSAALLFLRPHGPAPPPPKAPGPAGPRRYDWLRALLPAAMRSA